MSPLFGMGKNESIIAIGSKTLFSGHALPRWSKNFRLPNLAPYSRAEIAFSNDGLNQVGMIVKINRKLSLRVYGLPFIKMHYYRGVSSPISAFPSMFYEKVRTI